MHIMRRKESIMSGIVPTAHRRCPENGLLGHGDVSRVGRTRSSKSGPSCRCDVWAYHVRRAAADIIDHHHGRPEVGAALTNKKKTQFFFEELI